MTLEALELRIGAGVLYAVPSVHRCFPFAERVNELCADPSTRPDALAVELPALTAAEVRTWMVELGVNPCQRTDLPAMLALAGPASSHGIPETDQRSTIDLLYLTPSDSIVEAVRCAIELDVPVYGIDVEAATVKRRQVMAVMEDPLAACQLVDQYVRRNEAYAAHVRDAALDAPREHVMAAHLKYLLTRHPRVLVVCGLAHWAPIQELLVDPAIPALPVTSAADSSSGHLNRVIVHPVVALPYMDRFPSLVEAYQQRRHHPNMPHLSVPDAPVDATAMYSRLVQNADAQRFLRPATDPGAARDWQVHEDFESFLTHLCVVDQRRVPGASTMLTAAQGTMSHAYCSELARALMQYPWAGPRDPRFSALPLLMPGGPRSGARVVLLDGRGRRSRELVPEAWFGEGDESLDFDVPWEWVDERPEAMPPSDMVLNWPPIGRLVTALSLQAMERGESDAAVPRVEAFTGGLRGGLALKATLRAHAQGRDEWFVRDQVRRRHSSKAADHQWDPVVWLFNLRPEPRAEWMVLAEELEELLPLAQRPDEMRTVQRERGSVLIEQIGFGTRTWASGRRAVRGGHSMYEWAGMLIYLPTHFTLEPTARFVENTRYRNTPIVTYADPTSTSAQRLHDGHALVRLFQDTHGMTLDLHDWPTTLLRMAVPFAQTTVTLIAPDLYSVPPLVRIEAARRNVALRTVRLSVFSPEKVSVIATWYGARAVADTGGTEFPEALERRFGESASANSHFVPPYWRHYGRA